MRKKLISLLLCAVCVSVFCSACSKGGTKRELNSLAVILGIAIDELNEEQEGNFENFGEQSEKLLVTTQVVRNIAVSQNSSSSEGGSPGGGGEGDLGKPYWNVRCEGANLLETLRSAVHVTNRRLYIAQNQVVIFSKEVAEKGIVKYLDYFFRDHESRYDVDLIVAEENAGEILSVESHLESLPAQDLEKLIKKQKDASQSPICTMFSFLQEYQIPHRSTLVPMVRVVKPKEDDKKSSYLYVSGSAIFKEGKMVSSLNENQTRGALWVLNDVHRGVIATDYQGTNMSVEIMDGSGDFSVNFTNGKIRIKAAVKASCVLGELQSSQQIDPSALEEIGDVCEKEIEKEIRSAFLEMQSVGADVWGVGEKFYRYQNKTWKRLSEDFEELFRNAELNVDAKVDIIRTGSLVEPADENGGELYD